MYSFRAIDTFLTVVRYQNLSKAAKELNLAQTTVCKRLQMLEQEIGHTLIERSKGIKQLRLTPAGEEFLGLAERLSSIMGEVNVLQTQGPKLSLTVGAVDSLNTFVLPQTYRDINELHPSLKLEIKTLHSVDLYSEIENKRIDIGFALRERIHPTVNVKTCFESPMILLCKGEIAGANEENEVAPASLDPDFELFMPWGGQQYQIWHDRWWDPLSPSRVKLDSANLLLNLLRSPSQWAIVPLWVAKEAQQRGQYSTYRLSDSPPNYTCYKLTHKHPTSSTLQAQEIFDRCFQLTELITSPLRLGPMPAQKPGRKSRR